MFAAICRLIWLGEGGKGGVRSQRGYLGHEEHKRSIDDCSGGEREGEGSPQRGIWVMRAIRMQ